MNSAFVPSTPINVSSSPPDPPAHAIRHGQLLAEQNLHKALHEQQVAHQHLQPTIRRRIQPRPFVDVGLQARAASESAGRAPEAAAESPPSEMSGPDAAEGGAAEEAAPAAPADARTRLACVLSAVLLVGIVASLWGGAGRRKATDRCA